MVSLFGPELSAAVTQDVTGRQDEIEAVVATLDAGRHLVLEGPPGTAAGPRSVRGAGSYFLTHLLFLGKLSAAPLYALDFHDTRRRALGDLLWVLSALMMYNLSVIFELVPRNVFLDCGLDLDLRYPLPRRLAGQLRFLAPHKRDRERHRRTLDAFSRSTGVRCAPVGAGVGRG